jgi:predicted nucleic acid-binding protein
VIDVCSDASVAYQWFNSGGEDPEQVEASRALAQLSAEGVITLWVLDLTRYEIADAALFGRAKASADRVATVLDALDEVCPAIEPTANELREAARLAERHQLTMYDATYAAVARERAASLATLDKALLQAELGRRPSEIVELVRRDAG